MQSKRATDPHGAEAREQAAQEVEQKATPKKDVGTTSISVADGKQGAHRWNKTLQRVRELNLSNNKLDSKNAIAIADLLNYRVMTSLNLYNNDIKSDGGLAIAEALQNNSVMTSIDVGSNYLDEKAALEIVKAVQSQDKMVSLGLANCDIGPSGAKEISVYVRKSNVLNNLNLKNNKLMNRTRDNTGILAIAEALENNSVMTSIDVGYNKLNEEAALRIVSAVQSRDKMVSLGLAGCGIGPRRVNEISEYVRGSKVLKNLNVTGNSINGEWAQQLAEAALASLEVLSNVPIKELRENKHTELDLAYNGLGPTEGIVIAELVKDGSVLTTLDLSENELCGIGIYGGTYDASGIIAIADALNTSVLTNLDLSYNQLCGLDYTGHGTYNDSGIGKLASVLKDNNVLTILNVGYNSLEEEAALRIVDAVKSRGRMTNLGLASCGIGSTGAQKIANEYISKSAALTSLDLRSNLLSDVVKEALRDAVNRRDGFELLL